MGVQFIEKKKTGVRHRSNSENQRHEDCLTQVSQQICKHKMTIAQLLATGTNTIGAVFENNRFNHLDNASYGCAIPWLTYSCDESDTSVLSGAYVPQNLRAAAALIIAGDSLQKDIHVANGLTILRPWILWGSIKITCIRRNDWTCGREPDGRNLLTELRATFLQFNKDSERATSLFAT